MSSTSFYEQSKRVLEAEHNVCDILRWAGNGYIFKLEAGPAFSLDYALRIVKPDVFCPISPELVKPKVCPQDPQVWWVVTTTPVCFGWKNGHCKNIVNGPNGIRNKCKFRHESTPYIKVDMVSTETLLKKMKNRNKKLRENGTRTKKNFYINPFTGISYPCNYQAKGGKMVANKVQTSRKQVVDLKTKLTDGIKTNSHSFVKPNSFTTKWMIKNHNDNAGLLFIKEFEEIAKTIETKEVVKSEMQEMLDLDEYLRSSPSSFNGKSWADQAEDDDMEKEAREARNIQHEIENDGGTTVVRK